MSRIDAIYRHGVFAPLEPVNLQEEQRVRLSIEPADKETPEAWLERVKQLDGVTHGLVYRAEQPEVGGPVFEGVFLEPRAVMFHPPWDSGEYST